VVDNDVIMTSSNYNFLDAEFKNKEVKAGNVLISEPFLNDNNFSRSVVLITEHNEKGSFGLILNKPLHKKLSEIISGFENVQIPLFAGGPVDLNTLHVVHSIGFEVPGTIQISENLFWGGDFVGSYHS
jgi:putative transcriptional regulator